MFLLGADFFFADGVAVGAVNGARGRSSGLEANFSLGEIGKGWRWRLVAHSNCEILPFCARGVNDCRQAQQGCYHSWFLAGTMQSKPRMNTNEHG